MNTRYKTPLKHQVADGVHLFSDDALILTSGKSGIPSCRGTGQEPLKDRSSGDPSAAPTTRFRAAAALQGARARKQEENTPQESRTPHGQLTMVRSRTAPAGRRSEKSHFPSGRGGPSGSDWLQGDGVRNCACVQGHSLSGYRSGRSGRITALGGAARQGKA